MVASVNWVELAHPDHDGPEGEKHEYSLIRGRHGQKPGTPPMTSRTASGAKLLDGLESKHHCNVGVSLPRGRMPRQHEGRPIHPQGSFIHVFPRPRPGGGLLGRKPHSIWIWLLPIAADKERKI